MGKVAFLFVGWMLGVGFGGATILLYKVQKFEKTQLNDEGNIKRPQL